MNKKRKVLDLGPSSDKSVDYTDYAHHLAKKIGKKNFHKITGKNIDIIPSIFKIEWIKNNERNIFNKTNKFLDVQSFLIWFLI